METPSHAVLAATVPDLDAAGRWRAWQDRGTASDRRTAIRMRTLLLVIAAAIAIRFVVLVS